MLKRILYTFMSLLLTAGCTIENTADLIEQKVTLSLKTTAPTGSRAATESSIEHIDALVFREGIFYERAAGIVAEAKEGSYGCTFSLDPFEGQVTIFFIANSREDIFADPPVPGNTISDARAKLLKSFAGEMTGPLPMSAEITLPAITDNMSVENVAMLRAVAKAEVLLDEQVADFVLHDVRVIRANNMMQLMANNYTISGVTSPSVPQGAAQTIETQPVTYAGNSMQKPLYVTESEYSSGATSARIVIGGSYQGGDITYYSVDFSDNGIPVPVLRNKKYIINITAVAGPGAPDPGVNPDIDPLVISVQVVDWVDDVYGLSSKYLTITSQLINLQFYANATSAIWVETTYDDYNIRWCDREGNPVPQSPVAGWGDKLVNDDFSVSIESEGKVIRATALTDNELVDREAYVLVSADNMEFPIRIHQFTRGSRPFIQVFNITNTYGNIGDELLDIHSLSPTPNPMLVYGEGLRAILKNSNNFGYNGKVPFAGYYIAGLPSQTDINPYLLELFDVVYIPAAANDVVSNEEARHLSEWVRESGRVLVVQNDWGYNTNLLNYFNIKSENLSLSFTTQYAVSPDAPDYFFRGPFGIINSPIPVTDPGVIGYVRADLHPWITPLIVNAANVNQIIIGLDLERRIVYNGDFRLYTPKSFTGKLTGDGKIENDYDRLVANLWAWIAETVLGDH